jgi:preprotein translocase subunit SecY
MGEMFETLRNAWKIPDLRKRILFTVVMLIVFRIGSYIPNPGLDAKVSPTCSNRQAPLEDSSI